MNEESPIPAALPVVVPSPVGPAISYSAIRATTSRAQTLLDQLDSKVKKNLQSQLAGAGQVGAKMEQKILSRLADQLNPAEQLYNDTSDLIHNQLAASIAPAIVTLDDLKQDGAVVKGTVTSESSAGVGTLPGGHRRQAEVIMPPQLATVRAGALARQLARSSGVAAGGAPPPPDGGGIKQNPCTSPDALADLMATAQQIATDNSGAGLIQQWSFSFESYVGQEDKCCISAPAFGYEGLPGGDCPIFSHVNALLGDQQGVQAGLDYISKQIGLCSDITPPPGCPVIEPPKCPDGTPVPPSGVCPTPPTDHCPTQPCTIDVTCPPPIISVPPCPTIKLPPCVQIDLCDWDKFCDKIKECLIKAKEDCALDNDVAYSFKDCDGSFGSAIDFWYGDQLADVATPDSFSELAASASAKVGNFGDADFSPADPFL